MWSEPVFWDISVARNMRLSIAVLLQCAILLSCLQFWMPICSARKQKASADLETQFAIIYSHGLVHWFPSIGQSVAHCPMDITWFPLDTQNCPLIYESWAMPSAQLNITPLEPIVDFSYYQNSGEWQLIGNNAVLYEYIPMLYLFAVCCVITRSTLHILMFVRPSVEK